MSEETPAQAKARRQKEYRNRKRGGPPRELVACPSYGAYRRHQRQAETGKPSDCTDPEGCAEAYREYHREIRRSA